MEAGTARLMLSPASLTGENGELGEAQQGMGNPFLGKGVGFGERKRERGRRQISVAGDYLAGEKWCGGGAPVWESSTRWPGRERGSKAGRFVREKVAREVSGGFLYRWRSVRHRAQRTVAGRVRSL